MDRSRGNPVIRFLPFPPIEARFQLRNNKGFLFSTGGINACTHVHKSKWAIASHRRHLMLIFPLLVDCMPPLGISEKKTISQSKGSPAKEMLESTSVRIGLLLDCGQLKSNMRIITTTEGCRKPLLYTWLITQSNRAEISHNNNISGNLT